MVSARNRAMIELRRQGWSTATIGREYGISVSQASQLMRQGEASLKREQEALDARAAAAGHDLAIEHAGLGARATNTLRCEGLATLADVADAYVDLRRCAAPNFGKESLRLIEQALDRFAVPIPRLELSDRAVSMLAWNGFKRTSQIIADFGGGGVHAQGDAALAIERMTPELLAEVRGAVAKFSLPDRVASGSPYETTIGFSRAIRRGDRIIVSGTAPVEPDGTSTPGDATAQADRVFATIAAAIESLGGRMADVVRTRMYLVSGGDADTVGAVHARWLGDARPAATMVVVAALLRPEWRVEVEAEAVVRASS